MNRSAPSENVPLAQHTTLGVGGAARFFIEAHSEKDIEDAITFARHSALPLFVLGAGSNVLVPDTGVEGVVVQMHTRGIRVEEEDDEHVLLVAEAGTLWDDVVDEATARHIFGIENLAGIPGSVGGAAVQNIGAYGAEFANVFAYADSVDGATGTKKRISRSDAEFGYRTSIFKKQCALIITRVALRLSKHATPNTTYADLERARAAGTPLAQPADIAHAVRAIRAQKFPQNAGEGTAGSFFKNPVVSRARFEELTKQFPDLPSFPGKDDGVKLPLAWLLDHALSLKGFSLGRVRLYEKQPLVIVARAGADAAEVDALATLVTERVFETTGIRVEREVETFGTRE